jgi:hypothetical protein
MADKARRQTARKIDGVRSPRSRRKPEAALAPGLHAARVELELKSRFAVRLGDGRRMTLALGHGVSAELARECLRSSRPVIVSVEEGEPVILGALQTHPTPTVDDEGKLAIFAKDIRLSAERSLLVESGGAELKLDPKGGVRLQGNRLVVDIAALVRFLSARVELP